LTGWRIEGASAPGGLKEAEMSVDAGGKSAKSEEGD